MILHFPDHFEFGTSTAAYQIESAFDHDWKGYNARDGYTFDRTTDHEIRYREDADIIASLAPNYRMSLMWSKLQRGPLENFHGDTRLHYHSLLKELRVRNVNIMMVLHHFANPLWFASRGGWERKENISLWIDFAKRTVDEYGSYVSSWNTFNEPNLYAALGWIVRDFPPFKCNFATARRVIHNIAEAHNEVYDYIKMKHPKAPVGISLNCTLFEGDNLSGKIPAKIFDWFFMEYPSRLFTKADFFGMSYYARIGFDPLPVTFLQTPGKIQRNRKPHDMMWEYHPQGLLIFMRRFWQRFRKPIIITENGICTHDDRQRIRAIHDYLKFVHQGIMEGIDVSGYYHWSAWDNFEWSLGPSYTFGLYHCDLVTKERIRKPSADIFSQLAYSRTLNCERQ